MSLAVIAGRGDLPALVAAAAKTPPVICAYEGQEPEGLTPDFTFRLETLGTLLVELGGRGVTDVCFAGGIDRPDLDPSRLDDETGPLLPLFLEGLQKGDDGALRVVQELFERTGFRVIGAHEIAPDLLAKGGVYSSAWPDAQMRADAVVAARHIAEMSDKDVGQACIVAGGKVIAMEGPAGTDAMVAAQHGLQGKRAILFKGPKVNQTRQIDLPTIGPESFEAAASAGLAGIVVDAGDVLVLHPAQCSALADAHGIVFWARTGE